MSNSDSFIEEVSEEVRRERLFGYLRRYGWIAVVVVVGLVGGTAANEAFKAKKARAAQDFGDAVSAAMNTQDAAERTAALGAITGDTPGQKLILGVLSATEQQEAGDIAGAQAALLALAADPETPQSYAQFLTFKAALMTPADGDVAAQKQMFQDLAQAGGEFRLLAEENLALMEATLGNTEAALEMLSAVFQDAEITAPQRNRVGQWIQVLGGTVPIIAG